MELYKVTMFYVERKITRAGWKEIYRKEYSEVYLDNLEAAKVDFNSQIRNISHLFTYSTRQVEKIGKVHLFKPHVHENGMLAYWPDNEEYIDKKEFNQDRG
jgi:hypothetical protein